MGSKRQERVAQRRADRKEIKLARIESREVKQASRQEGRTSRTEMKQDTKRTAYEMGIDPNAAMWEGIGSLGKSAAQVTGDILAAQSGAGALGGLAGGKEGKGAGLLAGLTDGLNQEKTTDQKPKTNIILLAVAAVVVFLLMRKKQDYVQKERI